MMVDYCIYFIAGYIALTLIVRTITYLIKEGGFAMVPDGCLLVIRPGTKISNIELSKGGSAIIKEWNASESNAVTMTEFMKELQIEKLKKELKDK